jgi:predicted house-cleaning noncanonical NTP pyrophosphatase (MazG superfamily)
MSRSETGLPRGVSNACTARRRYAARGWRRVVGQCARPTYAADMTLPKLVRNRVPDLIRKSGRECESTPPNEAEYLRRLRAKLSEEVQEFLDAGVQTSPSELADIVEVIGAPTTALPHRGGCRRRLKLPPSGGSGGVRVAVEPRLDRWDRGEEERGWSAWSSGLSCVASTSSAANGVLAGTGVIDRRCGVLRDTRRRRVRVADTLTARPGVVRELLLGSFGSQLHPAPRVLRSHGSSECGPSAAAGVAVPFASQRSMKVGVGRLLVIVRGTQQQGVHRAPASA